MLQKSGEALQKCFERTGRLPNTLATPSRRWFHVCASNAPSADAPRRHVTGAPLRHPPGRVSRLAPPPRTACAPARANPTVSYAFPRFICLGHTLRFIRDGGGACGAVVVGLARGGGAATGAAHQDGRHLRRAVLWSAR